MKIFLIKLLIATTPVIYSSDLWDHAKLVTTSYLTLFADLKRFYNATSIYFISEHYNENLFISTIICKTIKRLSELDIFSQVLRYADMKQTYNFPSFHHSRQLFIVPIGSEQGLQRFSNYTKQHLLSYHVWFLIFWGKVVPSLRDFCENPGAGTLRLAFDTKMLVKCYDNSYIHEWWSVHPKRKILKKSLFQWRPGAVFWSQPRTHLSLYQRRNDVAGTILKISSVKEYPDALTARANGNETGMFAKIMIELASSMNFVLEFAAEENYYGYYNDTEKRWSGILGKLESKEIDVAVSEMTMTKERVASFDFTCPLILTRARLFIKEPGNADVQWNSYLIAFDGYIWLSLLSIIVLSAILLTLMKIKVNKYSRLNGHLVEQHLCVWGIFCQQGLSEFPDSSPLRIAYVSIFFSAIVLSAVYSASIISNLTLISPMLPFHSLPGFLKDSSYNVIVIKNSYEHDLFATTQDWVLKGMYRLMKKSNDLPTSDIEAFRQVCDERVAYYSNDAMIYKLGDTIPCKLASVRTERIDNLAFALTKYNPFTEFINYNILRFRDYGLIQRIKGVYFKRRNQQTKDYDSVGIWGIAPLLSILIFGIFLSIIILFAERLYHKMTCFDTKKIHSMPSAFEIAEQRDGE